MAVHITRAGVALTVGIIVLTGLIIGGLFWARGLGEQARREEAIAIAEQNLQADSNKEIVLDEGASDSTGEAQSGQGSGEAAGEQGATAAPSDDSVATQQPAADELPQTGPADGLFLIVLGLLAYAGTAYYQSRRTTSAQR